MCWHSASMSTPTQPNSPPSRQPEVSDWRWCRPSRPTDGFERCSETTGRNRCYELSLDKDGTDRTSRALTAQRIYVVLLDQHAHPLLAPDNFAFDRLWFRIDSTRKIPPLDQELAARIDRDGPYVGTDKIRDPRTDSDGRWRIDVAGPDPSHLAPLAGDTARRSIRGVRVRGTVDTCFRPTRMHVDSALLQVYFHCDGDPETYALTLRPPQTKDDLRGPPWYSPGAIVSEAVKVGRRSYARA